MLDSVTIVSFGGIVLYEQNSNLETVNTIIQECIIFDKQEFRITDQKVKYLTSEDLQLILIVQYPQRFDIDPELLPLLEFELKRFYKRNLVLDKDILDELVTRVQASFIKTKKDKKPKAFTETKKFKNSLKGANVTPPKPKNTLDFSRQESTDKIDTLSLLGKSKGTSKNGIYETQEIKPSQSISTYFSDIFSKQNTQETLKAPLLKMKEHLVNKNVSLQVAQELIDKIEKDLLGNKKSLKQQLKLEISKVLTPNISLNLLTEIKKKNSINEIYSICFVGVNGVGKSTNLSKICFWLLQNNLRVLIAACDTFRSGAVEQLKVHVRNLSALNTTKVELFSRGYGKDPAGIAKEAITFAKSEGFDVVLIDTAGRMQDNEPLMRALQKVNDPDKVIFVGEALVGNEGVDQIQKFDSSLKVKDKSIDGMVLTKFDTVDDKVGAALTMCYVTGKPIYFIGDGQTYTDLRKMNVDHVVDMLLSD